MTDARPFWPEPGPGNSWAHWVVVAERLGITFPLKRGVLLCFRGVKPFAEMTHDLAIGPSYDDTGVLIAGDGAVPPAVFPMATHAYQKNSRASPDVDGDKVGDVATIKPGRFLLTAAPGKYPVFRVTMPDGSERIPCRRDLSHTGTPEGDYFADSILVHWGFNAPADSDHSSSIGCLTMDGPWLRLLDGEAKRHGGMIDCVLADAVEVVKLCGDLNALERAPDTERPPA